MATTSNTVAPSPSPLRVAAQRRARKFIGDIVMRFENDRQCTTPRCGFNNIRHADTCEKCGSAMSRSSVAAQQRLVSDVLDKMAGEHPLVYLGNVELREACTAATRLVEGKRRDSQGFWQENTPQGIIDQYFLGISSLHTLLSRES